MAVLAFACILLTVVFGPLCVAARTVPFTVELTWGVGAPNGHSRHMIFVNGSFPGPTLTIDEGDSVEFLVLNKLPFKTSVHFHGITQLGTPWSDGVPGLSQVPIPAGGKFLYRWTADEYGTYFYHAHEKSQIMDGLPAKGRQDPFKLITQDPHALSAIRRAERNPHIVIVSDWTDLTSKRFIAAGEASGIDTYCTNSILINGKGNVTCLSSEEYQALASPPTLGILNGTKITDQGCSPPIPLSQGDFPYNVSALPDGVMFGCHPTAGSEEVFEVRSRQRWASFNFISAASLQAPIISIDEHPMWIYAVDGHYIHPQLVDGFPLSTGERYSAMVALDKKRADYSIRAAEAGFNQIISGFAVMSYKYGAKRYKSKPYFNYGGSNVTASVRVLDSAKLGPFPAESPAASSDLMRVWNVGRTDAPYNWALNQTVGYPLDFRSKRPMLYYPNSKAASNSSHFLKTRNNTWVDIVIQVVGSPQAPVQPPHPIHKHNNKAFLIGVGSGKFNWSTTAEAIKAKPEFFNLKTPPYRDMFTTPPQVSEPVWIVIRYHVVNPGAWLIHCHIQPHIAGGMAMALLDGVDAFPTIPPEYQIGQNGFGY